MQQPISLTLTFTDPTDAAHILDVYAQITSAGPREPQAQQPVTYQQAVSYPATTHPNPYVGTAPIAEPEEEPEELDSRNVPWHPDHHSSKKTQNSAGHWQRKRGHDKPAADAYEARYLGNARAAPAVASQGPAVTVPAPVASPAPIAQPQPVQYVVPTADDVRNLWNHMCQHAMVTGADEQHIIATWGGHPGSQTVLDNPGLRAAVHAYLSARLPSPTARAA